MNMSAGESLTARFEKIDAMLKDPRSEVNTDCLLVSVSDLLCRYDCVLDIVCTLRSAQTLQTCMLHDVGHAMHPSF